ncbi:unnamed protein product [Spirodela intermedia]|uniref:BHLH domain-containing protein n=1 Tax=Spirodela intermedia TaxID=51605 RepID=A0A7I8IM79_SPIIN|nr:unnamed protein product [Spirodela intermedia]CAA6658977.1 unnamed protein product [Spirodela intermedia]
MAGHPPPEGIGDDFFEQIFSMPSSYAGAAAGGGGQVGSSSSGGLHGGGLFPLGLSLDQGKGGAAGYGNSDDGGGGGGQRYREDQAAAKASSSSKAVFHGQPAPGAVAAAQHPPAPRPRVRARRGQATDPHSIAERLRRERIAERIRALQELVPNTNKTDRAAMLDEIMDYVKFLRLQVKQTWGASAVAQLVADIPLPTVEGEAGEGGSAQQVWEKWSNDGTEQQVAKLMEEDVGAAMQFLQSKALCIMPISLAATIYQTHHQHEAPAAIKPEPSAPS